MQINTRIWSPTGLQDIVSAVTGTRLLPYIRPVIEPIVASGLDDLRAYRPYQHIGFVEPLGFTGFR